MTGFWEAMLEQRGEREETVKEKPQTEHSSHQTCLVADTCPFDCIAITAPNPRASQAYLDELVHRVGGKGTKEVLILAVSDPEGVRIGSGGGTLNAILEIDECLSGGVSSSRVLLVHSGGDSQRSPTQCVCGKAWSALNSCEGATGTCNTPMDLLIDHLTRLFSSGLDAGSLVVTACDVMLLIPPGVAATADWSFDGPGGVAGLAIAADAAKYAPNHGVYCLEGGGEVGVEGKCGITGVSRYLQKPSVDLAQASGAFLSSEHDNEAPQGIGNPKPLVAVDSGVTVFSGQATAALARLAVSETFRGCTARGVAGGASALRLELYSDLLLALKTGPGGIDAYLAACGPALSPEHALAVARREVWDELSGFPLGAMLLTGATFVHLGTTPELLEMMTLRLPTFIEPYGLTARAGSVVGAACSVEDDPPAIVVNSRLDGAGVVAGGAVVEHCRLDGDGWEVGTGSLMSGVRSLTADHSLRLRSDTCLQQTDLTAQDDQEEGETCFVVSLFGVSDDIKVHHTAERARFCGATWKAFLEYAGATVEDVWGGVEESSRTLWTARLFPILSQGGQEQAGVSPEMVMWMQDVKDHASPNPEPGLPGDSVDTAETIISSSTEGERKAWLESERLSFKTILARADPSAEFKWRRDLEEGMGAEDPLHGNGGSGSSRPWDAVAIVASSMDDLHREAQRLSIGSFPGFAKAIFCVPPPRPSPDINTASVESQGIEWDGSLFLNAILVIAERYSALKRARFGSETSATALGGMRVLLRLGVVGEGIGAGWSSLVDGGRGVGVGDKGQEGGIWVLQRDGSVFVIKEESIGPLLQLCQSRPQYQALTYLGADNATLAPETPPGGRTVSAFDFITAAAGEASTAPPHLTSLDNNGRTSYEGCCSTGDGDGSGAVQRGGVAKRDVEGLKELDERAADEACTPAGAAQALARIACRLFELADSLGGGGHRSGPGAHADWQAAMRGLGTLEPLADGEGWGSPASLPSSVAALKHLRDSWFGVAGVESSTAPDGDIMRYPHPHLVVRCARHYERAAALVVSAAVATASLFVELPPANWRDKEASSATGEGSLVPREEISGENISGEENSGEEKSDGGGVIVGSPDTRPLVQDSPEARQRQQQQQRLAGLTVQQQGMARHAQAHACHLERVRQNGLETELKTRQERQRWEEEQQQQLQQEEDQYTSEALPVGATVTSRAAARIDLAGGWTDTPPISYEAGGSVVNVAVTVSGEKPVVARCERIGERWVELVCEGREGAASTTVTCTKLEDFTDFCVPQAPAALLKSALLCAGIVTLPSARSSPKSNNIAEELSAETEPSTAEGESDKDCDETDSLQKQLEKVFCHGGIRVTSRSDLPQGSGMGTSSILAGVVLSAVCQAAGRPMSLTSLVHAVLRVEQLMTAGGGHQDQVGGLFGGVKICRTAATLPLQVWSESIPLDPSFEEALNDRLFLVFTGKQRLARDLLQGVVRGWHDRLPGTVNTVKGLVNNAEEAANACRGAGDLEKLGQCLSTYWEQKKRMAPGAEPPAVRVLLEKLRPLCYGLSVCGAGGGGFVACITKNRGDQGLQDVTEALTMSGSSEDSSEVSSVSIHRGRVDALGMEVSVQLGGV